MSETYCAECGTKFLTLLGHDKNRDYLGSVRCPNCDTVIDMDEITFLDYVDQIRKGNEPWSTKEFREYIARNGLEVLYWGVEFWSSGTIAGVGMTAQQAIADSIEGYDSLKESDVVDIAGSHKVGQPVLREITEELYSYILLRGGADLSLEEGDILGLYKEEPEVKG